jgi:hypothetical protein
MSGAAGACAGASLTESRPLRRRKSIGTTTGFASLSFQVKAVD